MTDLREVGNSGEGSQKEKWGQHPRGVKWSDDGKQHDDSLSSRCSPWVRSGVVLPLDEMGCL